MIKGTPAPHKIQADEQDNQYIIEADFTVDANLQKKGTHSYEEVLA